MSIVDRHVGSREKKNRFIADSCKNEWRELASRSDCRYNYKVSSEQISVSEIHLDPGYKPGTLIDISVLG